MPKTAKRASKHKFTRVCVCVSLCTTVVCSTALSVLIIFHLNLLTVIIAQGVWPLYPLQDFKVLYKYCIISILTIIIML